MTRLAHTIAANAPAIERVIIGAALLLATVAFAPAVVALAGRAF